MTEYTDEHWEDLAPYILHYEDKIHVNKHTIIAKLAKEHYFGNKHFGTEWSAVKNLSHLIGDSQQIVNAVQAAKIHSKVYKSSVRFYYYSYRANKSYMDCISNSTLNIGKNSFLLFNFPLNHPVDCMCFSLEDLFK